jgi:hypothetical protein
MSEYPDEWRIKAIDGRFAWLDDHADGWQFGETGFIKAICERIGVDQAVEIGAGDGTDELPLTLGFLYDQGVATVLFEKDEASRAALEDRYPLADVRGEFVLEPGENDNLEHVSRRACVVVDVDSFDLAIARMIAGRLGHKPAILCTEHFDRCAEDAEGYGSPPDWLIGKQLADGGFIIQSPWRSVAAEIAHCGYRLVGISRINTVMVRSDLIDALEGC